MYNSISFNQEQTISGFSLVDNNVEFIWCATYCCPAFDPQICQDVSDFHTSSQSLPTSLLFQGMIA
eukprot:1371713-Amorphochlora_amoeboformis.AAC.1